MIHIKLYSRIKNNIKEILILFLIVIFTIILSFYKLPYYVDTPGGLTNINERIEIKGSKSSSGSYNLTYVSEFRGTIPLLIYAFLNPNWDIIKQSDLKLDKETIEEAYIRDKVYLNNASDCSVISAYNLASKKITIKEKKPVVIHVLEGSFTDLKVGDTILKIDDTFITNNEVKEIVENYKVGDIINILVSNNNNKYNRKAKIYEDNGKKLIGFYYELDYEYEVDPKIKITLSKNEYGPSGGFMTSLAIYDALIDEDLTNNLKIAGTGTIDINGNVGQISGIKYKLKGAVKNKADIFFVPKGSNYNEAIKLKKEKKYNIKIIAVDKLEDAIDYLQNL